MSYFVRAQDAVVNKNLEFGVITENSLQQFSCKDGEIAGWSIKTLDSLVICQVYDCSSGTPILIGNVQVIPGIDLTGGYFSSGCLPSGDPLNNDTVYFKVDYT